MRGHRLRTEIGKLVRSRRQEARLSQEALANVAGVHQSIISRIERGTTTVTVDLVEQVFGALDLQLRLGLEAWGAHLDEELVRLSVQSAAERLNSWDSFLVKLANAVDVVHEGALAALLQGILLPADTADIAVRVADVDALAAWLDLRGATRWIERHQEYRFGSNHPRAPGPLRWRLYEGDLRVKLCHELPESLTIKRDGRLYRVRPLAELELTDPLLAALLQRQRERDRP